MANRFIRLIEEGGITSVDGLRSAFRALALATHPDLGGEGGRGEDFIHARAEYEAALRYLGGASIRKARGAASSDAEWASPVARRRVFDRGDLYADLAALLKAGFPKRPRHDKEKRKYARLRLLVRSGLASLDPGLPSRFDDYEEALLELRETGRPEYSVFEAFLAELAAFHSRGGVHVRAGLEFSFARLCAESRSGTESTARSAEGGSRGTAPSRTDAAEPEIAALLDFLSFLVEDLGKGPALAK